MHVGNHTVAVIKDRESYDIFKRSLMKIFDDLKVLLNRNFGYAFVYIIE